MKKIVHLFFLLFLTSLFSQQQDFEVLNTSINSKYAEFGITYLSDSTVLFASSKKIENDRILAKDRRKNNRQLFLELYYGSIGKNGDIIQAARFSYEMNNKFFESDIAFTPDFKTMYFTLNNYYVNQKRTDSTKLKSLYLFKASIDKNFKLSNIAPLTFNSKNYSVRSPRVSNDGKKLYFVSNMPNGFGNFDVYVSNILSNGSHSSPKNLGENVNTKFNELFPFIDENNTLYFSSYGHKGKGNLDIFKSDFKNGKFQKAENLPSPFNSKYDDFAFVINKANNTGYFTSNRKKGKGDVDIYAFKPKEDVIVCTKVITGLITDIVTKDTLDNVLVSLYKNTVLQETKIIIKNSKYSFKLNCNENYKIIAKKENYQPTEFEIVSNNNLSKEISKNLELTPIYCNQIVAGKVINSKTNLPLEFVQVSLYENNILKESKNVNSKFSFDLDCNESYKIVAEKENFKNAEVVFQTNNNNAISTTKNLLLTPIECNQLLTGKVLNSETNLPIEYVLVSLYENNILKDTKTVNSDFSFNLNCNKSYKIMAEKENFKNAEIIFQTDNTNAVETTKTLLLVPLECNQFVNGIVLDKETNKPILNALVTIFKDDLLVETFNLNNTANFSYKLDCNTQYKIATTLKNYEKNVTKINTSKSNNEILNKTILLKPTIEFITIRKQKMIKTNPIYFDLDKYDIRLDAAIELQKVIDILNKYPKIKLEIKSHTDSRAPDNYNLILSDKRASSTMNYIISKGINPDRLTKKGYGESQLVNKCSNGVKCTQAEHELNRRTEFVITQE